MKARIRDMIEARGSKAVIPRKRNSNEKIRLLTGTYINKDTWSKMRLPTLSGSERSYPVR